MLSSVPIHRHAIAYLQLINDKQLDHGSEACSMSPAKGFLLSLH